MANELNWSSTETRRERERTKEALNDHKKAVGKEIAVKVGSYYLCFPESLTKAEIKRRVENHLKHKAV
jgi:hypothetical protein